MRIVTFYKKYKNIFLTVIFSLLVIGLVSGMSYIIYCYGFYDKKQDNELLEYYNSFKFDKFYQNMNLNNAPFLKKDSFKSVTNLMYNKVNLGKIYNSFFEDTDIYKDKEEFIKKYYYGYKDVSLKDMSINYVGKTNLISRRKAKVNGVHVKNGFEEESFFGVIRDITFVVEGGSKLKLDGKELTCNGICKVDYMFGGVHLLEYISNGFTYYSIINIYKDKEIIAVMNLNNLTAISKKINLDVNIFDELNIVKQDKINLDIGLYGLTKCNLGTNCPSVEYSYISLNNDGTCEYYFYLSLDEKGDIYKGTYKESNGFLVLDFNKRVYTKVNNNTKENMNVEENIEKKMTFKINDSGNFSNEDYAFKKKT